MTAFQSTLRSQQCSRAPAQTSSIAPSTSVQVHQSKRLKCFCLSPSRASAASSSAVLYKAAVLSPMKILSSPLHRLLLKASPSQLTSSSKSDSDFPLAASYSYTPYCVFNILSADPTNIILYLALSPDRPFDCFCACRPIVSEHTSCPV